MGHKRQRSETPDEPQTPNKRLALIESGLRQRDEELQASASLSPEAREKRNRLIQVGLSSVPSTPSRHAQGSARGGSFRPAHPVGIERRNLFPDAPKQTPVKVPAVASSSKDLEEQEEESFWLSSPPYIPIRTEPEAQPQPRSGPSSAGYHPRTMKSPAPSAGPSRVVYHNSIPTPPRSSPPAEDNRAASPSSMTQVSDLLRRSQDFEPFQPQPTGFADFGLVNARKEPETPTHMHNRVAAIRGGIATPSTPSKSIDTDALRDALQRLADLQGLPDDVDKLQRKLKATEQSNQKKQERIDDLEEELQRTRRKCEYLEKLNASLETRR